MGKDLWENLDRLYSTFLSVHKGKLSNMYIREKKPFTVTIDGLQAEALCYKVVNKQSTSSSGGASLHNVLIARHPVLKQLTMWCGDSKVVKEDREKEDKCNFWREFKTKKGEFICKHIVYAYSQWSAADKKTIEMKLGPQPSALSGEEALKIAFDLGKNILIYGPTGSRKSYVVRETLKGMPHSVCRINVTNGLEDIDLLQKLIPLPDGKGWHRMEGELKKAFLAARDTKVAVAIEELTRSTKSLRNLLIKAMDNEDGYYTLHDFTTGEMISVPAGNLLFMATANLSYSDTSSLDPALARRFSMCLFQDYDIIKEKEIIGRKVDGNLAERLCGVAKSIREQYRQGRLPNPLDTGSLIEWAEMIAAGIETGKAAELTWLFRIVEKDGCGYPEPGQVEAITELIAQV